MRWKFVRMTVKIKKTQGGSEALMGFGKFPMREKHREDDRVF